MRKILAVFLTLIMILSLTACGDKKDKTTVTKGDSKIISAVNTEDDKLTLELSADHFSSLSGNIIGIQFTVEFSGAEYSSVDAGTYPDGWTGSFTDVETANSKGSVTAVIMDDNLKTCFPDQKIAAFDFTGASEATSIKITDIKFVFYEGNDMKDDNIRGFVQPDFTAYPA